MKKYIKVFCFLILSSQLLFAELKNSAGGITITEGLSQKTVDNFIQKYKDTVSSLERQLRRTVSIEEKLKVSEKLNQAEAKLLKKEKEILSFKEFIENSNLKVVREITKIYENKGLDSVLAYFNSTKFNDFETNTQKNTKELSGAYIFKAKVFELNNEYDKAKKAYSKALEYNETFETLTLYADFLNNQNYFDEAIITLERIKFKLKSHTLKEREYRDEDIASVLNTLGNLYLTKELLKKAEKSFNLSLEYAQKAIKKRGINHLYSEIVSFTSLGDLAGLKHNLQMAEKFYSDAVVIIDKMHQKYPKSFRQEEAMLLQKMSGIYFVESMVKSGDLEFKKEYSFYQKLAKNDKTFKNLRDFSEGDKLLAKSSLLYKELVDENASNVNLVNYASSLLEQAFRYADKKQFQKFKELSGDALLIYNTLVEKNPRRYKPNKASVDASIALKYDSLGDFKNAEKYYTLSLNSYKKLVLLYPDTYKGELGRVLDNFSNLYFNQKELVRSKQMLIESIEISRSLIKDNPRKYELLLAKSLMALYMIDFDNKKLDEVERLLKKYPTLPIVQMMLPQIKLFRMMAQSNALDNNFEVSAQLGSNGGSNKLNLKDSNNYYDTGTVYYANKKYNQAIESFKKVVEIDPTNDDAYTYIGLAYKNQEKYNQAIEAYKKAININPKSDNAYYNMGNAYRDKEKDIEAIKAYKKAVEINPKNSGAYYNVGNIYYNKKEYRESIEPYKKLIELSPRDAQIYNILGNVYFEVKKYSESIKHYKKAIELDSNSDYPYYGLGDIYYAKQDYKKAINFYKQSIDKNFNNSYTHMKMGMTYFWLEKFDESIRSYGHSIRLNPNDYSAYSNLFELQLIQGQPFKKELEEKYIELFEQKEEVFISYEMLKILQNIVQEKESNVEKWKEKYRGVKLDWSFSELDVWVAKMGNSEKKRKLIDTLDIFKKYNLKDKESRSEIINVESTEAHFMMLNKNGEVAYQKKEYTKAIDFYIRAIKINSNYGQAYSNLGLAYQKLNRDDDALWVNKKAIEVASGDNKNRLVASSSYNCAKIYEKKSKWVEALKYYENALLHKEHKAYRRGIKRMKEKLNN